MQAQVGALTIEYETFGHPEDPALLLVHGLGAQLIAWEEAFCERLAAGGYRVIRFDNRDIGLSSKSTLPPDFDVLGAILSGLAGDPVVAPYRLGDMAEDALGLLDALGIDAAHVLGVSMGGMIAQEMAIRAPHRVTSLTSIMSTTGDPDVGYGKPEVLELMLTPPAPGRDAAIDHAVAVSAAIASPGLFDEVRARVNAEAAYDRSYFPDGAPRHGLAIVASGSRADGLRALAVPTLVIHGDADPLVDVSGGRRTAALVSGAELIVIDGMGHDLPEPLWQRVIGAIHLFQSAARAR